MDIQNIDSDYRDLIKLRKAFPRITNLVARFVINLSKPVCYFYLLDIYSV
jgi:hypothetical protein